MELLFEQNTNLSRHPIKGCLCCFELILRILTPAIAFAFHWSLPLQFRCIVIEYKNCKQIVGVFEENCAHCFWLSEWKLNAFDFVASHKLPPFTLTPHKLASHSGFFIIFSLLWFPLIIAFYLLGKFSLTLSSPPRVKCKCTTAFLLQRVILHPKLWICRFSSQIYIYWAIYGLIRLWTPYLSVYLSGAV